MNYNSDSTGEFNHISGERVNDKKQTMSAKILIAIAYGVGSKSYKMLLGLADTGTPTSLANTTILGSRSTKKKERKLWSTKRR